LLDSAEGTFHHHNPLQRDHGHDAHVHDAPIPAGPPADNDEPRLSPATHPGGSATAIPILVLAALIWFLGTSARRFLFGTVRSLCGRALDVESPPPRVAPA
jgi:hypothetical protein